MGNWLIARIDVSWTFRVTRGKRGIRRDREKRQKEKGRGIKSGNGRTFVRRCECDNEEKYDCCSGNYQKMQK